MAKGGTRQPQGQGLSGGRPAVPGTAPTAWGNPGAPGQQMERIPGQRAQVKSDPGTAPVMGYRPQPPAPPVGGDDGGLARMRSQLAMLMAQQSQHNDSRGTGGDRGYSRSPAGQYPQQMALQMLQHGGFPAYRT